MLKQANESDFPELVLDGSSFPYMPIEFFKRRSSLVETALDKGRLFKSSGTTDEKKSHVFFSKRGLTLYQQSAEQTFRRSLSHFFSLAQLQSLQGVSFIPPVHVWPYSSLAQMIGWFANSWSVHYLSLKPVEIRQTLVTLKDKPIWLFATAYHLISLYDQGFRYALHPESVVFETGGTKGITREVSAKAYRLLLSELFSLDCARIVSEYSMCELSTQAYSIGIDDQGNPLFSFPPEVDVFVSSGLGKACRVGTGSLIVDDPCRIDCKLPIRTQDVVELFPSKVFKLLARVPNAPLKGCSLLVKECLSDENWSNRDKSFSLKKAEETLAYRHSLELDIPLNDWYQVNQFVHHFFQLKDVRQQLKDDFACDQIVQWAIEDLCRSLPKTKNAWEQAVVNSKAKAYDHWLVIIPNSHPFVFFYPFLMAYMSQLRLTIRLSSVYHDRSIVGSFIKLFLKQFQFNCRVLPPSFRISNAKLSFDGLICYGQTKTVDFLKERVKIPVRGYGDKFIINIISDVNDQTLRSVLKDAFSLGQRGCLSSRLVLCHQLKACHIEDLMDRLLSLSKDIICESMSLMTSIALDHQSLLLWEKKDYFWKRTSLHDPLFPIIFVNRLEGDVLSYLSTCPFVLPFMMVNGNTLSDIVKSLDDRYLLSRAQGCYLGETSLECSQLGHANYYPWNGNFQRAPLFSKE